MVCSFDRVSVFRCVSSIYLLFFAGLVLRNYTKYIDDVLTERQREKENKQFFLNNISFSSFFCRERFLFSSSSCSGGRREDVRIFWMILIEICLIRRRCILSLLYRFVHHMETSFWQILLRRNSFAIFFHLPMTIWIIKLILMMNLNKFLFPIMWVDFWFN